MIHRIDLAERSRPSALAALRFQKALLQAVISQELVNSGRKRTPVIAGSPLGGLFHLRVHAHVILRGFSLGHSSHSSRFDWHCKYTIDPTMYMQYIDISSRTRRSP